MPGKKGQHRKGAGQKKRSDKTVSRRTVLKIGAAAGAATVLAPNIITSRKAFASLLQGSIGRIELVSGEWVSGFICEGYAVAQGTEITHLGGWRRFIEQAGKSESRTT